MDKIHEDDDIVTFLQGLKNPVVAKPQPADHEKADEIGLECSALFHNVREYLLIGQPRDFRGFQFQNE